jgi:hypothetical protein
MERGRVLLLGSVPLPTADEVFSVVSAKIGDLVKRIPDGETGERLGFISWANSQIANAEGMEIDQDTPGPLWLGGKVYKAREGVRPSEIDFGAHIYADAALRSYESFYRLRERGTIAPTTRFQVSLPTPIAVIFSCTTGASRPTVWTAYERHLLKDVEQIVRSIPHDELAIQWDVATEIDRILEFPEVAADYSAQALMDSIARLSDPIPSTVELGIHFCYGDPGHKHIIEPKDMRLMVTLANMLTHSIRRQINWIHMPVPKDRHDAAYFAPLTQLNIHPSTEMYLGLVHLTDGKAGAERRIQTARKFLPSFGVATECGWGRRQPETLGKLLELHRVVAELTVA